MAQGSTGFSKQEIEALMAYIPYPSAVIIQGDAYKAAYDKLSRVRQRLIDAEEWKRTRGW